MSLSLIISLLLAAPAAGGQPVATVDGLAISPREVTERLNARRQRGEKVGAEEVMQGLVDEALLAAEAERQKLALPAALQAQVDEARLRAAGRIHMAAIVDSVPVDEAMLREVFHLNADSARFKLLVLATPAAAEAARDRIREGGTFLQEARNSLNPDSARNGGDMGLRSRGQLPQDLAGAVFAAPLDEVTGPVALSLGFAVLQVAQRTIGTDAEFQAKRASLVGFARNQVGGAARRHYLDQLRAKEKVKLDEAFLLSTGSASDRAQADHVLAVVSGRPLRYGELLDYIEEVFRGRPQGHAFGASVKVEMAGTMIDDRLLEADAARAGVDRSPEVTAEVAPLRREALATALAAQLRQGAPAPTDAELAAWYRDHAAQYRVAALRRCRGIVVQNTADAARVVQRLEAGEAFPAVARSASIDERSAGNGGDLGEISFDTLAAMEQDPAQAPIARTIRGAPAGELVGPVAAGGAQYLFRCEALRPERQRPYDEVRGDVAGRARAEAGQRAYDSALARLRSAARITIDREAVLRAAPSPH